MDGWLNLCYIVEQKVKDKVAFMLVCSDNPGINWDMIGYQSIRDHAFFKPKYFGEYLALIVWMAVSNFCPSLLEWVVPSS